MHALTIDDLPPPPPGRSGWPWTEGTPPLPAGTSAGFPRVSIVTPSFNQAEFLEETIRSVLLQGYPDLEYMVIDGGSGDGSVEIIRKYEPWLHYWVSERDRGQTHAINKGLERATGAVFNWVNSDDTLCAGALQEVGGQWAARAPHVLIGAARTVEHGTGRVVRTWTPKAPSRPDEMVRPHGAVIPQPSTFVATRLVKETGLLREDLHCVMDWELYLRLWMHLRGAMRAVESPRVLCQALDHPDTKTNQLSAQFQEEAERVIAERWAEWTWREKLRVRLRLRQVHAQTRVGEALGRSRGRWGELLRVGARFPDALLSRYYWGGLRRALVATHAEAAGSDA